jgi:hypothetical protein
MTALKVIEGGKNKNPTATGCIEFEGAPSLFRMSVKKRQQKLHAVARVAFHAAQIAGELYIRDNTQAVDLVRKEYDLFASVVTELAEGEDAAEAILDIIRKGRARLDIALAVVEGGGEA